jgi:hypothetical protein
VSKNFPFFTTFGGFPKPGNKIEKYDESCKSEDEPHENMKAHTLRMERKTEE